MVKVRRGFTIIEMLLVVGMTSMVMGAMCALYAFCVTRLNHVVSAYDATSTTTRILEQIDRVVQNCNSCAATAVGSKPALVCTVGSSAMDSNADNAPDNINPVRVTRRGSEVYGSNNRVWFYFTNATGTYNTAGDFFVMAVVSGSSTPTNADIYWNFSKDEQGRNRFAGLSSITFTVNSDNTVTTQVVASSATKNQSASTTEDAALTEAYTGSRRTFLTGWKG